MLAVLYVRPLTSLKARDRDRLQTVECHYLWFVAAIQAETLTFSDKCFAWHFLNKFRVSVAPDYWPGWRMWPIPYPRDGLLVTLTPV